MFAKLGGKGHCQVNYFHDSMYCHMAVVFAKVELLSRCLLSFKAQISLPCKQRMFVYCWVYFAGGYGKDEIKRRDTYKTAMTHCVDIVCWSSCLADEWNKLSHIHCCVQGSQRETTVRAHHKKLRQELYCIILPLPTSTNCLQKAKVMRPLMYLHVTLL